MNRAFSPLESPAIPGPDRGAAESADPRSPGAAPVRSAGGANHVSLARSPHRYTQLATGSAPWARPSAWTSGAPPISVPEGRSENSTALQCRGPSVDALTSPVGTTEMSSQLQSSLRDSRRSLPDCPGTEVPGYYHCVPIGTPGAPIRESNSVILLYFTWSVRVCV